MTNANPITGLQHIAIEASDMQRSIDFYRDFLGMRLTERHKAGEVEAIPVELAFLRLSDNHHDLVLAHNPNKTYRPRNADEDLLGPVYPHHFAFACKDRTA